MRTVFKFRYRKMNSLSCAHVLHKTLNWLFHVVCFAENGEELYQNVKRTCRSMSC